MEEEYISYIRVEQLDGTFKEIPISAFKDENGKSITDYLANIRREGGNLVLVNGDGTPVNLDVSYKPPTENTPSVPGFVPAAQYGDRNKFLKGDGTWGGFQSGGAISIDDDGDMVLEPHDAETAAKFGGGTTSRYGHVRVSNNYSTNEQDASAALSQLGANNLFEEVNTDMNKKANGEGITLSVVNGLLSITYETEDD